MLPDAKGAADEVALGERRVAGLDHPSERERSHHLADLDRRHVRAAGVHPAAHRRVQRDVRDLDDELAVAGVGHGALDEVEVRVLDVADGAGGETQLAAHGCEALHARNREADDV